jgi:hypothetical protein
VLFFSSCFFLLFLLLLFGFFSSCFFLLFLLLLFVFFPSCFILFFLLLFVFFLPVFSFSSSLLLFLFLLFLHPVLLFSSTKSLELRSSTNSSALQRSELRCNTQSCAELRVVL